MLELDGSLTDLEILSLDDAPSPEVSPTSTEASSESTPAAEPTPTAEATPSPQVEPADNYAWAAPLLRNPEIAKKFEAAKERLSEFEKTFGSVAGAREFKQMLAQVGGIERLKSIVSESKAIDQIDEVAFGYRGEREQRDYLAGLYRRSEEINPGSFARMAKAGLDLIKTNQREDWPHIVAPIVGEVLERDMVWEYLERIYEAVQRSGDQRTAELLNSFAGVFTKYGLGPPMQPETGEVAERRQDFNSAIGRYVESELDGRIAARLQELSPGLNGAQSEIAQRAHAAIRSSILADSSVRLRLKNAMRTGSFSMKTAEQIGRLLIRKAEAVLPRATKCAVREYELSTKRASATAPRTEPKADKSADDARPLGRDELKRMTVADILDSTRPIDLTASANPRAAKLTKQEARNLSFQQVVNDDREVGE